MRVEWRRGRSEANRLRELLLLLADQETGVGELIDTKLPCSSRVVSYRSLVRPVMFVVLVADDG